ncbi:MULTISPECIES: flagellar basal body rod protein FlgB [Comamonas]|jgi:flagellar basal-body rod protein FlgB|uniref:Flagellar basal body rod protein FlgB n=1 Tax=Comamonas terrigena TaxID=32013 RepID=A0A2A7URD7_COMTR|nr:MULTISPECIES: flagellar basal body rod protein FlgB [Comamonas]MBP7354454.1 flagellar basal body rod protein FlgB [Comamonas sp.]MBD9533981.1 flagellar basal body rod protein FlgB [Comamonas sp. CMM01]MBV7419386.1 flagellar basal body rod protein FlgB [Comamonas sp. CMM03]MDH0049133.1 flagellar basal body rod protein FlgB [Comamonas terrigena]MDH0512078.1 flagellar basal body rod protein FlgB [Comamonas terrigena]
MALNFDSALSVHAQALRVRSDRTQLLASNLANASTPGYQSRDIDFAEAMARTGQEAGLPSLDWGGSADALFRVPNHPSQDGNTVEVGVEQALFSQNASDFQTSLTFLNMKLRGLQSAIKGE